MSSLSFRQVCGADLAPCYALESSAYEGDEAASEARIARRIADYPQGFLVLEKDGELIGFINSGCAQVVAMSQEEFKELIGHDTQAPHVVIMSVVIAPLWQGQGYASLMMREFVCKMRLAGKHSINLMCKQAHIPLYQRLGYHYVQASASDHGGVAWHEMRMDLTTNLHAA